MAADLQKLVRLYRRHEDRCKRSGYASMGWKEFKASRLANPLSRAATQQQKEG